MTRYDSISSPNALTSNWNFWSFLAAHRRKSDVSPKSRFFSFGKKQNQPVGSLLGWPVTSLELETYISRLTDAHQDNLFLGDVKINQLHAADGLYRSPSAPPALLFQMISSGKLIFLTRNNLLEAYLSGLKAEKCNVWHCVRKNDMAEVTVTKPQPTFYVAPEQALWGVNILENDILLTKKWLDLWGDQVLRVVYEDLFDAETGDLDQLQFKRLAVFCGLPIQHVWEAELIRNSNKSNVNAVENLAELRHYFRSHGAGHWFSTEADLALEPAA